MKKYMIIVFATSVLLSLTVKADLLSEYRFDQTNLVADTVADGITAGDLVKSAGYIAATDGKANPYGLPHWKNYGIEATLNFTLAPNAGSASYSNLSFAVQMDSLTGTQERKLELTSSATGATVLYTLYNYAAWQTAGSNPGDDHTTSDWTTRDIDLSGFSALQNRSAAATFTLTFSDISTSTPAVGNLRLDNIGIEGTVIPEPATLGLISLVGGCLLMIRRIMLV